MTVLPHFFDSELMKIVKDEGKRMMDAQPSEAAVGNMVRRGKLL
jgi:hypothetical protein